MSKQDINEIVVENSTNSPPPPIQQEKFKGNIGYNCSECSSLIEILSINEDNLEFKCTNNNNHNNKLNIRIYLEKMKKNIDNKNLNDICEKHNNQYNFYCLDCKYHICEKCISSKIHKAHNKRYLKEEQPNEEDINIIKNKIEYYNSKIRSIKQNKIKEFKKELNNNKIKEKEETNKIMKMNKIRKIKELKLNEEKYINDINEIKRKYENEIKLRKIKYEKEINEINNKYKIIYNKEMIMNKNKIKELNYYIIKIQII